MHRMGKLIRHAAASVDGYTADEEGNFDWTQPDEEQHAANNDLLRSVGLYLLGRRMYETMLYWEDEGLLHHENPVVADFAQLWKAARKIVYSSTLTAASGRNTELAATFEPEDVRALKRSTDTDIAIGGPSLASVALQAGLIDKLYISTAPILVGDGLPSFPTGIRADLQLISERTFANGAVMTAYRVVS
jgi:dihydrofolate reductase